MFYFREKITYLLLWTFTNFYVLANITRQMEINTVLWIFYIFFCMLSAYANCARFEFPINA